MKVYELPEGAKNTKGRALQNLLNIESGDKVRAYIACKQLMMPNLQDRTTLYLQPVGVL